MAFKLRTYKVEHLSDPRIPIDSRDPAWNDPATATIAVKDALVRLRPRYGKERASSLLLPLAALPFTGEHHIIKATLSLEDVNELGPLRFRGSAVGHLEQSYSQGPGTKVIFSASALKVGVVDDGFCFLDGLVGREFGVWGAAAALAVRFFAGDENKGGLVWEADLDPPKRLRVEVACFAQELAASFAALTKAELSFYSKC